MCPLRNQGGFLMRTRIYNKMMASEVNAYLDRGGDTIFVPVGVIETHGACPIDVEQIIPEAFALKLAGKADGLAMINLPYFFPGGTIVDRCTVQMSVRQSIDFLMNLCRSLKAQGFRKIIMLSAHGPAELYINSVCRDFFQEEKLHVCHINLSDVMMNTGTMAAFEDVGFGAYAVMGQKAYLPVDPDVVVDEEAERRMAEMLRRFQEASPAEQAAMSAAGAAEDSPVSRLSRALAPLGGKTSIYFADPSEHGGGRPFKSEEERDMACARGEAAIDAIVDRIDIKGLQDALDAYHAYVDEVMEKNPRLRGVY